MSSARFRPVRARCLRRAQHLGRPWCHERVGVDLAMWVIERHPYFAAAVLEAEHLLDGRQCGQFRGAVGPRLHDQVSLSRGRLLKEAP